MKISAQWFHKNRLYSSRITSNRNEDGATTWKMFLVVDTFLPQHTYCLNMQGRHARYIHAIRLFDWTIVAKLIVDDSSRALSTKAVNKHILHSSERIIEYKSKTKQKASIISATHKINNCDTYFTRQAGKIAMLIQCVWEKKSNCKAMCTSFTLILKKHSGNCCCIFEYRRIHKHKLICSIRSASIFFHFFFHWSIRSFCVFASLAEVQSMANQRDW